MKLDYTVIK